MDITALAIALAAKGETSSRELATLTGKKHFHVMRDIRTMLETLGEDGSKFLSSYRDAYQREKPHYILPMDQTITLLSGYSVKLRMAVVERWMELEAAKMGRQRSKALPSVPPQSFAQALQQAAAQAEMEERAARLGTADLASGARAGASEAKIGATSPVALLVSRQA